jgi:hypothetical protein
MWRIYSNPDPYGVKDKGVKETENMDKIKATKKKRSRGHIAHLNHIGHFFPM